MSCAGFMLAFHHQVYVIQNTKGISGSEIDIRLKNFIVCLYS